MSVLLLAGVCAPPTQATCSRVDGGEVPRLGGLGGAWVSRDRFVLTDFKRQRLLEYATGRGFVQSVYHPVGGPDFIGPWDLERWQERFLLAGFSPREARILQMDADMRPLGPVSWPADWAGDRGDENGDERGRAVIIQELEVLGDTLFAWVYREREEEGAFIRFDLESVAEDVVLRETASWPDLPSERINRSPLVRRLASTRGDHAAVYALRFGDVPFIERFGAGEEQRLAAFPEWPRALPVLPTLASAAETTRLWSAIEAASYPSGLYAEGNSLHVLTRTVSDDATSWELHQIDPLNDEITSRVRLPSSATFVYLLAGREHWLMVEGASYFEDTLRQPTALFLLDSEAIRAGDRLSCD